MLSFFGMMTFTIELLGTNDVPVVQFDSNSATESVSVITGDVSLNDSDVDSSDVLTYSVVGQSPAGLVLNPDGTYTYGGRSDDMLKVSGIYVSPFEVEATLVQHPAVLEAAVIGKVDADGLTKTKAFVVLKPGQQATEAELQAFVKEKLAPYKYPRFIEFLPDLPKTATGKIQRFRLREREQAA